jgi:hypothetical protein
MATVYRDGTMVEVAERKTELCFALNHLRSDLDAALRETRQRFPADRDDSPACDRSRSCKMGQAAAARHFFQSEIKDS